MTLRLADIVLHPDRRGHKARIAAYFAACGPGAVVTREELVELCWGRRADGGPLSPSRVIDTTLKTIRDDLRPGWRIDTLWGVGLVLFDLTGNSRRQSLSKGEAA
jgi:DNA-binding response OmpR family regulator